MTSCPPGWSRSTCRADHTERLLQPRSQGRSSNVRCRSAAEVSPNRSVLCNAATLERQAEVEAAPRITREILPPPASGQLLDEGTAFCEEHRVRAYEVGPDQRATIVTIANLIQEVAGNHGVAIWGRVEGGFAADPIMVSMSLIFVATRIQLQLSEYPRWGDLVSIETWFQAQGRMAAARNWIIRKANTGQVIGRGTSTWVMVNTKTRRLSKIPEAMRVKLVDLAPKPHRHTFTDEEMRVKVPDVKMPAEFLGPVQVARRSDMDMNGHINNAAYLAWALETVPKEVFDNWSLSSIEIDYKGECTSGDTIDSLGGELFEEACPGNGRRFTHLLRKCNDQGCTELTRARTFWQPYGSHTLGNGNMEKLHGPAKSI
ncbi:hypothetical protein WJX84_007843 [Apatococcus fuscideae]|uniref:Acyl-[acyl-carrier-protein] hydrolase n=1 Tax=Apatococcus fuscideae TaxID=2026836 RepID=A0AAW1ST94_9CHLO